MPDHACTALIPRFLCHEFHLASRRRLSEPLLWVGVVSLRHRPTVPQLSMLCNSPDSGRTVHRVKVLGPNSDH